MPVILPPVLIDPVGFSRQSASEFNPMEFKAGDNLYALLLSSVTNQFGIFKSTDGGDTWTEQDAAGAPSHSGSVYGTQNGTIICVNAGGVLVEFDTGTDTYGTPGSGGGPADGPLYVQADGTTYVALNSNGAHIRYYTYTFAGGSWTGPNDLLAGNFTLASLVGDSTGSGHVTYYDGTDLKYFRLSTGFVVGSQATLGTVAVAQLRTSAVPWDDRVAIAWSNGTDIKVSVGTPLSGPTFSTSTVYTRPSSDEDISYPTLLVDNDDALRAYFVVTNYNTDPFIDELRVSTSTDGATWPTPTLFYDEIANPPADSVPDQESQFIHTGDVQQLSSGRVVFLTALETSDDATTHCTGFALLEDPATLELIKVVVGGTATPEDFTLTAIGGSPEVEISGAGHVGPEEVSPGTYELSETDQTGAQWGDATWGDATWGGNYTPGAWDCGDAEMPTPTSVVVPEGGTVACSITNTFTPTPPPPGPGNGEENPVGCFELLRVDVTLMPSRHLPTRGSVR